MAANQPGAAPAYPSPQAVMSRLLTGYWMAQAIHVAAHLGIADLLKDGPQTVAHLAESTGTHARSLYRLLRALASEGVFAEDEQGRFGLTPLGERLRSDIPNSQRWMAIMNGEEHYRCWGELLYSVQTGQNAFEKLYGQPIFQYLASHPRQARIFDEGMVGVHGAETKAMLDAYDFGGIGTLVDVGGGNGSLLLATLERYPSLRGMVFDRPDVIERARSNIKAAGLENRCTLTGGNFFETVPAGGDSYLMRHIIHDWNDEQCRTILRHCRKAVPPAGKLLLIESVIPPGNEPCFAKLLDLTMLAIPGGMERNEAEYRELLASAGFRLARVVPTTANVDVIECVPA
ncbi:MAG TPA: methyltransferase [Gemmataceae bacterium]|nr:methyltransferase [Gemmataceae bacterium]